MTILEQKAIERAGLTPMPLIPCDHCGLQWHEFAGAKVHRFSRPDNHGSAQLVYSCRRCRLGRIWGHLNRAGWARVKALLKASPARHLAGAL